MTSKDVDPETRKKKNKLALEGYYRNHEARKKRKNEAQKIMRRDLYKKLGGKCVSCGEKFNPNSRKSNLEFHHKFYDEDDMKAKKKGGLGGRHHYEIQRMVRAGINPKKKFILLCQQCNSLEGFVRINPKKAFDTFCWLHGEGMFDEALKDDPTLKRLTEFMKK